jgi:hypothetical protein
MHFRFARRRTERRGASTGDRAAYCAECSVAADAPETAESDSQIDFSITGEKSI